MSQKIGVQNYFFAFSRVSEITKRLNLPNLVLNQENWKIVTTFKLEVQLALEGRYFLSTNPCARLPLHREKIIFYQDVGINMFKISTTTVFRRSVSTKTFVN